MRTEFLTKQLPKIIGGVAIAGVAVTSFLLGNETPIALKKLEEAKKEKGKLTKMEVVKVVAPCYIPAIVTGVGTVGCIAATMILSGKAKTEVATACASLNEYYREYRNEVIRRYGEEVDNDIMMSIYRDNCEVHIKGLDEPDKKVIFYDIFSDRSVEMYEREIMDAEYHLNRNFTMRGYASLNEFYEFLGLEPTDDGELLGWSMTDGYTWIDIEHKSMMEHDDNGTEIYEIVYIICPSDEYLREWE